MRIFVIPDGGLYNLDVEGFGLFKMKPTPWKWRFPRRALASGWDGGERVWGIQWLYAPWHRVRISMGEGLPYAGGLTLRHAFKRLCDAYGEESVRRHGHDNADEMQRVQFPPSKGRPV